MVFGLPGVKPVLRLLPAALLALATTRVLLFAAVAFAELVNLTCRIQRLLFTGVERVTLGADFDAQILARG